MHALQPEVDPFIGDKKYGARVDPSALVDLSQAIERAAKPPGRWSTVQLNDTTGRRYFFQLLPVLGWTREVFFVTTAVDAVIGVSQATHPRIDTKQASELLSLTS